MTDTNAQHAQVSSGEGPAETCEVAVLGGGMAGLVAAWYLRNRNVVLLEAADRVGGRVKTVRRGDYWANLGAQYMAGTGPLAALIERFNIPCGSLAGTHATLALHGRLLATSNPAEMVLRAPLSLRGRIDFARFGLRIRRAYKRLAENSDPDDAMKFREALENRTADTFVAGLKDPDVLAIFRSFVGTWMGDEAPKISAGHFGLNMGSALIDAAATPNFSLPVGGNQVMVETLERELGGRIRLGSRVSAVSWGDTGVEVLYEDAQGTHQLNAKQCVVAMPAHAALKVFSHLPEEQRHALEVVHYGPFVVAGIFTNEKTAQAWDSMYSIVVPNRSFQIIYNPTAALRRSPPRKPGGAIVAFSGGDVARSLLSLSDSEVTDRFLADLTEILPGSGSLVAEVVIQRWPQAIPYWGPGDRLLMRRLRTPMGPIHFAGDYVGFPASMKAAAQAGEAASRGVMSALAR